MKLETKNNFKKIIISVLGIICLCFGIGMNIKVGIGVDPLSATYDAVSKIINLSLGTTTALISIIYLVLGYVLYKKNVGIATLLFIFISKYPIDFAYNHFVRSDSLIINIVLCLLTILIIALGSELFIFSSLGACPYDSFTMGIGKRLKHEVKYIYIRWASDGLLLILAILLKGDIGIGTILSFAFVGIFMKWWQKILEKFIKL